MTGRTFLSLVVPLWLTLACGGDPPKLRAQNWIGKTYLLDTPAIGAANWTKPSGALVGNMGNYGVPQFVIGVAAGSGDDLVITLSSAQEGKQDGCVQTTQTTSSGADYPHSTITTPSFPVRFVSKDPTKPGDAIATLHNVQFEDILPGLESPETSRLDVTVDFAEIAYFLYSSGTKDTICQIAEASGSACETCPSNGAPYCITAEAVHVSAQISSVEIAPISPNDVPNPCNTQQ